MLYVEGIPCYTLLPTHRGFFSRVCLFSSFAGCGLQDPLRNSRGSVTTQRAYRYWEQWPSSWRTRYQPRVRYLWGWLGYYSSSILLKRWVVLYSIVHYLLGNSSEGWGLLVDLVFIPSTLSVAFGPRWGLVTAFSALSTAIRKPAGSSSLLLPSLTFNISLFGISYSFGTSC